MTKRTTRHSTAERILRIAGVVFFIAMLALAGLSPILTDPNTVPVAPTPATNALFPEVPAGGVPITLVGTYVHPSGLFTLPEISGWARPGDEPEETVTPLGENFLTRAGATYINNDWASVAHAFVEDDPTNKMQSPRDLQAYYDNGRLGEAWVKYTGGWKELSRRIEGDALIIDTEMYYEQQTYLGRQISRLQGRWLMVLRLVAPNNNPGLLNALQSAYLPGFKLWETARSVPLNWKTLADFTAGYMVRYPTDWKQADGTPGKPYTLTGDFSGANYTLITQSRPVAPLTSIDEAKAWVMANIPKAAIQGAVSEDRGGVTAFSVSYTLADADGNRRSTLITLIAGAERLYSITLSTAGGRDLLAQDALPGELMLLRRTLVALK